MKYYSYIEPDENEDWKATKIVLSEQEILAQWWDEWSNKMKELGKAEMINQRQCIEDFCTIHWASEESVYRFHEKVYQEPFAPYYDNYKGHEFVIDHFHPEDPRGEHVMMACVDDHSVKVNGYVHLADMELV